MINRKCTISEYYRGLETQGCPDFRFFFTEICRRKAERGNTYVNQKDRRKSRSIYINRITYPEPAGLQMFSACLREKVWSIAMEMNYVPNEAARNLKKGTQAKESKIWYINVLMTRTDESRTDPFFTELLRVVESEIHEHNCILSKVWYMPLFSDDRKCRRENLDQIIQRMYTETEENKDGLIIIGRCNPLALKKLNQKYRSVVSVNRNSTNYEVDEVLCDGKKIAQMAVEHLISLGHRNIGYVGGCRNEDRYVGYLDTLKKNNLDVIPEYVVETDQTEREGYEARRSFEI